MQEQEQEERRKGGGEKERNHVERVNIGGGIECHNGKVRADIDNLKGSSGKRLLLLLLFRFTRSSAVVKR